MQRRRSHTVTILLGTGTGSFGAKTGFATGDVPASAVAVGDFNGDGKLDLATANLFSNTVSILLGTGMGSFGAKTDFATGSGPVSVAVGDFNSDGKLDLAVGGLPVSILLNTGPIGFSLGFDSPTVTVARDKVRVTVNINRTAGFTGNVTVTPPSPLRYDGCVGACEVGIISKPPTPIATTDTSVTFKLKITSARRGRHQVTFTGRDDSGRTIAATITVIVCFMQLCE